MALSVQRYYATLRCRTWNVWPERAHISSSAFRLDLGNGVEAVASIAVACYLPRSLPHDYRSESGEIGPLVWRGEIAGLYVERDTILKAPEDEIGLVLEHEPPRKGEIDLVVGVDVPTELPVGAADVLSRVTFALLSVLNLRLGDRLVPCAPLQIARAVQNGRQFKNTTHVAVHNRETLTAEAIGNALSEFRASVIEGPSTEKLQLALEILGAHSLERSGRARFLLLVTAMEVLTGPSKKHPIALQLLEKWRAELQQEKRRFGLGSEEALALDALERELVIRREASIRSQIRNLWNRISSTDGRSELSGRAVEVYDKRSTLVHEGRVSASELVALESEAHELLEIAIRFFLS